MQKTIVYKCGPNMNSKELADVILEKLNSGEIDGGDTVELFMTAAAKSNILHDYFKIMGHSGWDTDQLILYKVKVLLRTD